eukprot:759203-Hanusia_phi.AAC.4
MFTFWGSKIMPNVTPSEICLPFRLKITLATLDPEEAKKLPVGTRISVWATQKERGPKGALSGQKALIATLRTGEVETAISNHEFYESTLLSFSVQPKTQSCTVHLSGYFDHAHDKLDTVDDNTISWAQLQSQLRSLLASASGHDDEDNADEEARSQIQQMKALVASAQNTQEQYASDDEDDDDYEEEDEEDDEDEDGDEDEEEEEMEEKVKVSPVVRSNKPLPSPSKGLLRNPSSPASRSPKTVRIVEGAVDEFHELGKRKHEPDLHLGDTIVPKRAKSMLSNEDDSSHHENGAKQAKHKQDTKNSKDKSHEKHIISIPVLKPRPRNFPGFSYTDVAIGSGKQAQAATKVTVRVKEHSTGKKGTYQSLTFMVGLRDVATGLDKAVVGMREGGSRTLELQASANDAPIGNFPHNTSISLDVLLDKVI